MTRRPVRQGIRALTAGLIVVYLALPGCSRPGAFTVRNLLLLSVDRLPAERLGCYGDPNARTPFWDRLAREGCPFRTMTPSAPGTVSSHVALLGGTRPGGAGTSSPPQPALAEILSSAGIATAAFLGSNVLDGTTELSRGFGHWDSGDPPDRATGPLVSSVLEWLHRLDAHESFFVFVYVHEVHEPWESSPPWKRALGEPGAAEIAATDRWLLRLLRGLEGDGRLRRTMVVATAGQGEGLLEDEADDRTVRRGPRNVPLVLWGPLPFRGGRLRQDPARGVDVLPTALEAFRVGTKANRPGRALQKMRRTLRATSPAPPEAVENGA